MLEEGFEPLTLLQIILIFAPDQPIHVDHLLHLLLGKGRLEQFVILNVLEVGFGLPVDAFHGDGAWEHVVHELARHSSGGGLFDFGEVHVEEAVEKVEDFFAAGEVSAVHHSEGCVNCLSCHCWIGLDCL